MYLQDIITTNILGQNYVAAADFVTAIICVVLLIVFKVSISFYNDSNFTRVKQGVVLVFFASLVNVVFFKLVQNNLPYPSLIVGLRYIYHILLGLTLITCVKYIINMLELTDRSRKYIKVYYAAMAAACAVEITSPVTKLGFCYMGDGMWKNPSFTQPYVLAYSASMLTLGILFIAYRKSFIRKFWLTICILIVFSVLSNIYGALIKSNTYGTFAYIMPILVVIIILHSMPYNHITGAMNGEVLNQYIKRRYIRSKNTPCLAIITCSDSVENLPYDIKYPLYKYYKGFMRGVDLFNAQYDMLVFCDSSNGRLNSEEYFNYIVKEIFKKYEGKYRYDYKIIQFYGLAEFEDIEDFKLAVKFFAGTMENNSYMAVTEEHMEKLGRYKYIRGHLMDIQYSHDIDDERIVVFAQPIKNVKTDTFDSAEILMRLKLPHIGMVYPSDFIELAEEEGIIHSLSKIILNKTCQLIYELADEGYHFDRLSVNLSAVEFADSDMEREILQIIDSNGISRDKIAIELTESKDTFDMETISGKINRLKSAGLVFYLDDFGTGYSNMDRILKFPFDLIKFDKLFVDSIYSVKAGGYMIYMIKAFSQTFKDFGYKILFEGVESEEQREFCMSCQADYLQGYVYSKPVHANELRAFFSKKPEAIRD